MTSTEIHLSWVPPPPDKKQLIKPEDLSVLPKKKIEHQSDEPVNDVLSPNDQSDSPEKKDFEDAPYSWYKSEKQKFSDDYSTSDVMMDPYRSKRERRSHRHRKRRQDNSTDPRLPETGEMEAHQSLEIGNTRDVVKKSYTPVRTAHKTPTPIAYVLYYEQGVARSDATFVKGVPTSQDLKSMNFFSSDLGMEESKTKNLTLLNTSGKVTKVVGFRLKYLSEYKVTYMILLFYR